MSSSSNDERQLESKAGTGVSQACRRKTKYRTFWNRSTALMRKMMIQAKHQSKKSPSSGLASSLRHTVPVPGTSMLASSAIIVKIHVPVEMAGNQPIDHFDRNFRRDTETSTRRGTCTGTVPVWLICAKASAHERRTEMFQF